mgnify:CR=1 FL=1
MIQIKIVFQRLRNLYQLGTTNYVFLGAIHTRFEHSIGTYYLAGRILKCINERTNEDLMHEYLFEIKELHNYFKRKNIKITRNKDENKSRRW